MAEIEYMPWKRIVLHEVKKVDVGELLQTVIAQFESQKQSGTPAILWADGLAFVHGEFPETRELIDEKLKGILHYAIVNFAETSFQDQKRAVWNGKEYSVKLVKVDSNPDLANLAKFLRGFTGQGPGQATPAGSAAPAVSS